MLQRAAASAGSQDRGCWDNQGSGRNIWAGYAGISNRAGYSDGARNPVSWMMPPKGGAMSSRNNCRMAFSLGTLNLAEGRNIEGATTMTWSVPDAQLQLVVSAEGSATITFTVADAALAGALSGEGSASITFSVGDATLGAIVDAVGSVAMAFSASAEPRAIGHLAGNITPFTELSPQSLAQAVLDAVVEGDLKMAELLRILLATAAGDATGLDGSPAFKSRDGLTTRVAGTIVGGDRTITTFDPS
jgi:hypothetical protein